MSVRLIAHALIQHNQAYLVLKRSTIKRGQANVYPPPPHFGIFLEVV